MHGTMSLKKSNVLFCINLVGPETEPLLLCLGPLHGEASGDAGGVKVD